MSNKTLILDTHLYEVEFPGGKITELAASILAESMYVQCDVDRNEYLLLMSLIDNRNDTALGVEDQKVVVKGYGTIRNQQLVGTFVVN